MKTKFNITVLLMALGILMLGETIKAAEKTKEYRQAWPLSEVQTLQLINKYGEVKVTNNQATQITIEVKVTVGASSESKAQSTLDRINVRFSKSGMNAKAETTIESSFGGNYKLQIDYLVNIPSDKNLEISNKYGNTFINDLKANGKFDIQYGNFNANSLFAPKTGKMELNLAYGKSSVSASGDLWANIKYSNSQFGETGNLSINSAYSGFSLEKALKVVMDSKYDTYAFDKVESIETNAKYTNFKIGSLAKNLKLVCAYGGLLVREISPGFENIDINSSYGNVSLGLGKQSYSVNASCSYCGIRYPQENFKGDRVKEDTSISINGKVGTDKGGNVKIISKYGEIKLTE